MTVGELMDALLMFDQDAIVLGSTSDIENGYREVELAGWSRGVTDVAIIRLKSGREDKKIPTSMIRDGWRPPKKQIDGT